MSEKLLAGVDFSGAKTDPNPTWLAVGRLGNLGLEVMDLKQVGSSALAAQLMKHDNLDAVGIDCPFSLPSDFLSYLAAKKLRPDYQSWQEVAEELVFMSFDDFVEAAKAFKKEPKRFTDSAVASPALSPLHRGNPSMVQMTFHGIRLLAALDPKRFFVLPFQKSIDFGCSVLEVYPRETLRYLTLPNTGYKSKDKKEAEASTEVRRKIIQGLVDLRDKKGLTYKDCPRLTISKGIERLCEGSDHALDAVVALYATALFVSAPQLFDDPLNADNLDVLLEGWIYTPRIK